MSVLSTKPTSDRGYLSQDELEQFADITVTDTDEADDRISQAEEIIDDYCGYQEKFLGYEVRGLAASATSTTITLQTDQQSNMNKDFLRGCFLEIIGGTGEGQRRRITGQTYAGVVTVTPAFATTPDTTSYYKIWQLGSFPRANDVIYDSNASAYFKTIPVKVRRAVAAQVEYLVSMGDAFFRTDKSEMESERIGDYEYTRSLNSGGSVRMIAPKAKLLLHGFTKRTGAILE